MEKDRNKGIWHKRAVATSFTGFLLVSGLLLGGCGSAAQSSQDSASASAAATEEAPEQRVLFEGGGSIVIPTSFQLADEDHTEGMTITQDESIELEATEAGRDLHRCELYLSVNDSDLDLVNNPPSDEQLQGFSSYRQQSIAEILVENYGDGFTVGDVTEAIESYNGIPCMHERYSVTDGSGAITIFNIWRFYGDRLVLVSAVWGDAADSYWQAEFDAMLNTISLTS